MRKLRRREKGSAEILTASECGTGPGTRPPDKTHSSSLACVDGGHSRALLPAPLLVNLVPLLSELMLPDYVRRLGLAQEVVTVSVLKGIESPGAAPVGNIRDWKVLATCSNISSCPHSDGDHHWFATP
ncbi:hypothetical protein mRhiFer1_008185 [Rhinolophus ferrumequinum]|uniref:Uncharacterized protein n=1 Tax=Rhinolophus ferrumequinum TaxID=59479 RepID=A0A7J7W7J7_RHIFE|nr:hypothetical protein mRhiFer1_008185 [Rhinolophus ferrumequinum]